FIGIKVKQLALHMLYWIRQRDERDVSFKFFQKGKNIKHLDEILHQPPIYLGIHYLRVLGGRLAIPRKYGQMSFNEWIKTRLKDTTDKSAINTLNDMFEKILNKVDFPRQKESDFSIGKLMLELWYSCYEGNISEQSLKELCDKSWELVEITGQAALISLYLEKIRLQEKSEKDQLNLYDQFWHLVQPAIFPEYRRESIITKGDIAPGISDRILWFFRLF
nr:hypothetical protein [Pleurocapsa sp. MO_226.B13]